MSKENKLTTEQLVIAGIKAALMQGESALAMKMCQGYLDFEAKGESQLPKVRVTKQSLENVRNLVPMHEVLSGYLTMHPVTCYLAKCPFCESEEDDLVILGNKVRCGRCEIHLDAIQFLMCIENMSFKDAYKKLVSDYDLPENVPEL